MKPNPNHDDYNRFMARTSNERLGIGSSDCTSQGKVRNAFVNYTFDLSFPFGLSICLLD